MRLLQICNKTPWPAKDGGCIAMNLISQGLINKGHQVKILAFNLKKNFTADFPETYLQKTNIETVPLDTSIKILDAFLNLFSKKSFHIERFRKSEFENLIIKTLQEQDYDIIQLESLFVTPYIETIRKYTNAPIVLRAHNIEHLIWERMAHSTKNPLKKVYLKLLAQRLKKYELETLKKLDGIAAITEIDAEFFRKQSSIPALSFPVGIEEFPAKSHLGNSEKKLFHLGSMDWMPNQEGVKWLLDHVWPLVFKQHPDALLLLAGRNMPSWLSGTQLPGVEIVGEVEDANQFIIKSGIMVVPLLSGSGMRVKIIEGLAAGKPIVSTSIGAEGIPVSHTNNILIADMAEDFAHAICSLLEDAELQQKLSINAMKLAKEKLLNKTIMQNLENFYQMLLSSANKNV